MWDLENNVRVNLTSVGLQLNWKEKAMTLAKDHLDIATIVHGYLLKVMETNEIQPVNHYIQGLTFLAKSDIHMQFINQAFQHFFICFSTAVQLHEKMKGKKSIDLLEIGYDTFEKMMVDKETFNRVITLGLSFGKQGQKNMVVSVTDVWLMKQYSGMYLMTLAVRKAANKNDLKLILS